MNGSDARSRAEIARRDAAHAARRWAESGLAHLTGLANAPASIPRALLPLAADRALAELAALAPAEAFAAFAGDAGPEPARSLRGAELLAERAACYGFARRGRTSAGGSCRLLEARGGWLAANLPRADDARALAAWLEDDALAAAEAPLADESWRELERRVRERECDPLVERARWLGLAVAPVAAELATDAGEWLRVPVRGPAAGPRGAARAPLVVELASLWAGPLAGRLLRAAGARVLKVESTRRPDGARAGNAAFFDRLNHGKRSVALDFSSDAGRRRLAALLDRAELVIEGSRPRALAQLGIDAEQWVRACPGRVWLSFTGYGREAPAADWIAFGDDAAAAAGLCWRVPHSAPLFVGDAIADPLAGIHGALAALSAWRSGAGGLLDVALTRVVASALGPELPTASIRHESVAPPRLLGPPPPAAPALGADTARVLAELDIA